MPQDTTALSPLEEQVFQRWAQQNQIKDLDNPNSFYDYRGFWKANPTFQHQAGEHFTDQFKQHGHPTFSRESQYSQGPNDGGTWDGDTYRPALALSHDAPHSGGIPPDQLRRAIIELLGK